MPTKLSNTAAVGSAVTRSAVTPLAVGDLVLSRAIGVDKKRDPAAQGAFHQRTRALNLMCCPVSDFVTYQAAAAALPVRVVGKDRGGLKATLDLRQRGVCAQKTVVSL